MLLSTKEASNTLNEEVSSGNGGDGGVGESAEAKGDGGALVRPPKQPELLLDSRGTPLDTQGRGDEGMLERGDEVTPESGDAGDPDGNSALISTKVGLGGGNESDPNEGDGGGCIAVTTKSCGAPEVMLRGLWLVVLLVVLKIFCGWNR